MRAARYGELLGLYRQLYPALREVMAGLAAFKAKDVMMGGDELIGEFVAGRYRDPATGELVSSPVRTIAIEHTLDGREAELVRHAGLAARWRSWPIAIPGQRWANVWRAPCQAPDPLFSKIRKPTRKPSRMLRERVGFADCARRRRIGDHQRPRQGCGTRDASAPTPCSRPHRR